MAVSVTSVMRSFAMPSFSAIPVLKSSTNVASAPLAQVTVPSPLMVAPVGAAVSVIWASTNSGSGRARVQPDKAKGPLPEHSVTTASPTKPVAHSALQSNPSYASWVPLTFT